MRPEIKSASKSTPGASQEALAAQFLLDAVSGPVVALIVDPPEPQQT